MAKEPIAAAFFFAVVICAVSGAVLLHLRDGASLLFRGGLRLVLAGFVCLITLWAVDGFIATFISKASGSACQIAVSFAGTCDQLARITLEEFIIWSTDSDFRTSPSVLLPQAVMLVRFVLGGIFLGLQRSQFHPSCVARSPVWPVAFSVLVTDGFIMIMLLTRASSFGVFQDLIQAVGAQKSRAKGIILTTVALGIWILSSAPMILGVSSFGLAARTVLPALGVLFVIACIAFFFKTLTLPPCKTEQKMAPYADESPKTPNTVSPPTRKLGNQYSSMSDETLVSTEFQPTRQESKPTANIEMEVRGVREFDSPGASIASTDGMNALPTISTPSPGQSTAGVGGLPIKGQLFPPLRFESLMARPSDLQWPSSKSSDLKTGKLVISHPVIQEDSLNETSQLRRMASVDLATAAKNEKKRREDAEALSSSLTLAAAKSPQSTETADKKQAKPALERREASSSVQAKITQDHNCERSSHAVSSSVLTIPSPSIGGSGSVRQRSPKHISHNIPPKPDSTVSQSGTSAVGSDSTATKSGGTLSLNPNASPRQHQHSTLANSIVSSGQKKLSTPKADPQSCSPSGGMAPMPVAVFHGVSIANQRPSDLPKLNQTGSRAKSSASLDTLVPQVPPLSPRSSIPQTYYELEGSPIVPTRNMDSPSDASRSCSTGTESRPSMKTPVTPPAEEDLKPLKTPVQLRKALGTPTNSRTKITKASDIADKGQAILFIDSTDYDDSKAIQGIIEEISTGLDTKSTWGTEDSGSVVNRPRPITRRRPQCFTTSTKELPKLPETEASPVHTNACSMPHSTMADSRQLSALPPRTSSAGISNLSSANQSDAAGVPLEGCILSTMHSLPPARSSPDSCDKTAPQPKKANAADDVAIRQEELSSDSVGSTVLSRRRSKLGNKYISNFSIATTTISSDEISPTSTAKSPILICLRLSHEGLKRKSSPVLPLNDLPGYVTPVSSRTSKYSDNKSPALSAKRVSDLRSLATTSHGAKNLEILPVSVAPSSRSSYVNEDDDRELVTIMLDRSWEIPIDVVGTPPYNRVYGGTEGKRGSWHRRIGESPPTFSGRNSLQSRRGSPPRPLELDKVTRGLSARPAPQLSPLETPQRALEMIQEQLKKLEEPNGNTDDSDVEKEQLNISGDIAVEKGGDDSRWKQMRDELARVSFSTNSTNSITIPPNVGKLLLGDSSDAMPSIDAKILSIQYGDAERRPLVQSDEVKIRATDALAAQPQGDLSKLISQETDKNTHLEEFSQPHTTSYKNSEPEPIKEDARESQLGDLGQPIDTEETTCSRSSQESSLISASEARNRSAQPHSYGVTDASRQSSEVSVVGDSELGRKHGERRSSLQMSDSTATGTPSVPRPRTSRPPRRSRRISTLPDIVEDPEPLKNKRGTLGIFQFPWGERSDTATMPKPQPSQLFMRRPNTISGTAPLYPTLDTQVQMLHSQGQSSSYFDCQEDDEAVDEYAEDSDESCYHEEADDAFDETTLWEIASLLQTDQVPSRHSLLPGHEEHCNPPLMVQEDDVSSRSAKPVQEPQEKEVKEAQEPNQDGLTEEFSHRSLTKELCSETLVQSKDGKVCESKSQVSSVVDNVRFFEAKKNQATSMKQESPTAVGAPLKQASPVPNTNSQPTQSTVKNGTSSPAPLEPTKIESLASRNPAADAKEDAAVAMESTSKANSLWAAPNAVADQSVGLPQPELDAWDKYNDKLGTNIVRSKSRKDGKLKIESQSLWSRGTPTPEEVHSQTSDSEDATAYSSSDEEDPSSATAMITMSFALPVVSSPLPEVEPSLKTPQANDGMIPLGIETSLYSESQDDILSPNPVGRDLWVPISMMPMDEDRDAIFEHSCQQGSDDNCKMSKPSTTLQTCQTLPSVRRSLPPLEPQSLWTAPSERALAHRSWVALSSTGPNASTEGPPSFK